MSFDRFLFDGENAVFGYRSFNDDGDENPKAVTADFDPNHDGDPSTENFNALGLVVGKRSFFLLKDSIYSEPLVFNNNFPAFYYSWGRKDNGSGAGRLTFLRIDFSEEDFINYEDPGLAVVLKQGRTELFQNLPLSIAGAEKILDVPIPHTIDFEEFAMWIFADTELEVFSRVCHAINS